jgi:hypothetical protein
MPSRPAPMGKLPETKVDVKAKAEASSAEAVEEPTREEATEEVEIDESDIDALKEEQKVPYQRFKAKVDETKSLKSRLEEAEARYANAIAEKQALMSRQHRDPEPTEDILDVVVKDPQVSALERQVEALKAEIGSVKKETSGDRLKNQLNELKAKFPKANVLAAMGIKKHDPSLDLEEIMESLHTQQVQEVESSLKAIIEKKKVKQKNPIPINEGGFKLKDSEKPKTVKEATALAKRLFGL